MQIIFKPNTIKYDIYKINSRVVAFPFFCK